MWAEMERVGAIKRVEYGRMELLGNGDRNEGLDGWMMKGLSSLREFILAVV